VTLEAEIEFHDYEKINYFDLVKLRL